VLTFQHSELYLACNRGVDDARIDRLNRLLQTMAHDGTLALITHRYAGRSH
jgi:polar amino acid transport system substrate-binding protein